MTQRCLVEGIDESRITEMSLPELRAQILDCVAQVGRQNLILSPGCTIPTQTPWYMLQAVRDTCSSL